MNAMRKLEHIFTNNRTRKRLKIRIFKACVESIFLYNSELWTVNKTTANKIHSFHRRMLRKAINIKWPRKISNEQLYNKTKHHQQKWSNIIKTRRIRWYGHLQRLPEKTPAKISLQEARRTIKRSRGGQVTTWLSTIEKDLIELDLSVEDASHLAHDRREWRKVVRISRALRSPEPDASQ
ncbi:hypothetical protein Pmani_020521 [Petrolisthes manimaculis]|uniref:Endonuclease-reverse transcriptase n=1 Tax=Petrolisthes manimaculis TaxID=1843537 RepID=A0AAE1U496_9EUCA|nr:hypothetical protein Pmani_020521 [Petrolisthes manimaculis]